MSAKRPVEGDYSPAWQALAQMVVGASVAEPEFEHLPVQFPDEVGR